MKRKSIIGLMIMPALLVSCNKTKELYAQGAYDTPYFDQNYYLEYNNIDKVEVKDTTTATLSGMELSCPSYNDGSLRDDAHILTNVALKDQTDTGRDDKESKVLNWYEDDPKTGYGKQYGPTKCMSRINNKFSYGILSKLYDGRVHCDGYYAKSRVQLNKTGFGTFFPAELKSAKYFAVSLRSTVRVDAFKDSLADIDLHFNFYQHVENEKYYNKFTVDVPGVNIRVANRDAHGALLAFYFDSPTLYQWKFTNIVGMSMSFELKSFYASSAADIEQYGEPTDDMNDKEKPHFAIYLYEMLFPESTWL